MKNKPKFNIGDTVYKVVRHSHQINVMEIKDIRDGLRGEFLYDLVYPSMDHNLHMGNHECDLASSIDQAINMLKRNCDEEAEQLRVQLEKNTGRRGHGEFAG